MWSPFRSKSQPRMISMHEDVGEQRGPHTALAEDEPPPLGLWPYAADDRDFATQDLDFATQDLDSAAQDLDVATQDVDFATQDLDFATQDLDAVALGHERAAASSRRAPCRPSRACLPFLLAPPLLAAAYAAAAATAPPPPLLSPPSLAPSPLSLLAAAAATRAPPPPRAPPLHPPPGFDWSRCPSLRGLLNLKELPSAHGEAVWCGSGAGSQERARSKAACEAFYFPNRNGKLSRCEFRATDSVGGGVCLSRPIDVEPPCYDLFVPPPPPALPPSLPPPPQVLPPPQPLQPPRRPAAAPLPSAPSRAAPLASALRWNSTAPTPPLTPPPGGANVTAGWNATGRSFTPRAPLAPAAASRATPASPPFLPSPLAPPHPPLGPPLPLSPPPTLPPPPPPRLPPSAPPRAPPPAAPPLPPPSPPPPPRAKKTFFDHEQCTALMEDAQSRFHQLWNAEGWKLMAAGETPCWGRRGADFFDAAWDGRSCGRNWYTGNAGSLGQPDGGPDKRWVRPHFTAAAPALLGFDRNINWQCDGRDDYHAEACVKHNLNILSLYGNEVPYNMCRNLEWQICAAKGQLPGQETRTIIFSAAPNELRVHGGDFPLGACNSFAPLGCRRGYASADIFYLETCIYDTICRNRESFWRLRSGQAWHCELDFEGYQQLYKWFL
ncbi:hypothetical protein AB1Y20_005816 [Prymnesium parvum]|uniref:Uncharacterized protein n=1 Tax=Prymnesium parvum TaxID=97485 RepID=A0AB34J1G5_PRYPA